MKNQENIKKYSELQELKTYEERFNYLHMKGSVGEETFGFDRWLNQKYYKSKEWQAIRDKVIIRDSALDLGIRDISGNVIIHHMNPINIDDLKDQTEFLRNPEYLICVSRETHNAIHYGDKAVQDKNKIVSRTKNDQIPWKK